MALRDRPTGWPGSLGTLPRLATTYLAGGLVLRQVGTELVTPTDGQLYVPIEGAVTVPTDCPEVP